MQSVLGQLQGARFHGHRVSVKLSRDCPPGPKAAPPAPAAPAPAPAAPAAAAAAPVMVSQGTQTNPWLLEWGRAQGTQTGDGDETDLENASEMGTLQVSPTEAAHSPTVSEKEEKEEEEPTMLVDELTRKNLPLVVEKNKVKEELGETKKELAAVKKEIEEESSEEMGVNKASPVLPPGPKLAESSDSSSSSSE